MSGIVFMSDLVESNEKTWKKNNLAIKHDIPIGTLVEITYKSEYEDPEESNYGLRLFVVNHSRDCDGTPLYDLSFDKMAYKELEETKAKLDNGVFENHMETHSLSVLKKSEGVRLNTDLSHLKKSLTAFFISDTLSLYYLYESHFKMRLL